MLAAATAVLTAGLLAVASVGTADARDSARKGPSCELASAPPLAVQRPDQAPPAGRLLRRLADRLRPLPSDAQAGRYAYSDLQMQAADTTPGDPCVVTVTAHADEQRWRADDGSGQVSGTPWHLDPANPPAVETTTYSAGELRGVVPGPVPTDPATLAAALDAAYPPGDVAVAQVRPLRAAEVMRQVRHGGTAARVRAVSELNGWHYVDRAARRAVLLVLADVKKLKNRGSVAGYPGAIAVSVDTGDWRDLLVLDPQTGAVLAYEQVLLRNGHLLGVRTPYMNARIVYIDRGRSSQVGCAPAAEYRTDGSGG